MGSKKVSGKIHYISEWLFQQNRRYTFLRDHILNEVVVIPRFDPDLEVSTSSQQPIMLSKL